MLRKEILLSSLNYLGASQDLLGEFDLHSTIELEMDSDTTLFLSEINGHIWIWAKADCINAYNINTHSDFILSILTAVHPYLLTEQYILGIVNDSYQFKGLLSEDTLSSAENLAFALESFYFNFTKLMEVCS